MTYVPHGQSFWHGVKLNTICIFCFVHCIYSPNQDFVVDKIEDILWYVKLLKTISLGSPVYVCYELSETNVHLSEFVVIVLGHGNMKHRPTDTFLFYSEHKCNGSLPLVTFLQSEYYCTYFNIVSLCNIIRYYGLLYLFIQLSGYI